MTQKYLKFCQNPKSTWRDLPKTPQGNHPSIHPGLCQNFLRSVKDYPKDSQRNLQRFPRHPARSPTESPTELSNSALNVWGFRFRQRFESRSPGLPQGFPGTLRRTPGIIPTQLLGFTRESLREFHANLPGIAWELSRKSPGIFPRRLPGNHHQNPS